MRFFADGMIFVHDAQSYKSHEKKMEDDNLNNGLDGLLEMFKKLIESQDLDAIPGINEEQKEQLKMFLEDFDELKNDMKVEMYKLDPFSKQMVEMVMGQLKNLGDNPQLTVEPTTPPQERLTYRHFPHWCIPRCRL